MTVAYGALTALGDPTRQAILDRLKRGPAPVGVLAEELPVTRSAVSQHLKVLKEAGLVRDTQQGTRRIYEVDPAGVRALQAYFGSFWDQALAGFRDAVEETSDD